MNQPDFFNDAPVLELELPDFDQALDRAIADETDNLAFSALTTHLERARANNDLGQLYQMSMVLGAAACMHDHMQGVAGSSTADILGGGNRIDLSNPLDALGDRHDHQHDHSETDDDDDEEDKKKSPHHRHRH